MHNRNNPYVCRFAWEKPDGIGRFKYFITNRIPTIFIGGLLGLVFGYLFTYIPTLGSPWVNAIIGPVVQFVFLDLLLSTPKGKKHDKLWCTHSCFKPLLIMVLIILHSKKHRSLVQTRLRCFLIMRFCKLWQWILRYRLPVQFQRCISISDAVKFNLCNRL